ILTYLRLSVLPFGQSIDHDFPISRTLFDHGAWVCAVALLTAAGLALWLHRRARLFCFGLLMFLIWLAPTSSVIPIADPLVERRMYLPLMGLILVACDAASRMRLSAPTGRSLLVVILLLLSMLTWQRNTLWG